MPLEVSDFDLSPDEMDSLVKGAQEFLPPAPDPADAEEVVVNNE